LQIDDGRVAMSHSTTSKETLQELEKNLARFEREQSRETIEETSGEEVSREGK